jgi:maltooligosyltrehalose trehalohydrolase
MRRLVSEGRKRDFACFGWDESQIPDPEDVSTFERSKLIWSEIHKGEHAEMLDWTKQLIHLRRTTIALNDGDLGHLKVECREEDRLLIMQRGTVRSLSNLGEGTVQLDLLEGESLCLSSHKDITVHAAQIVLPKMSFAILMTKEDS